VVHEVGREADRRCAAANAALADAYADADRRCAAAAAAVDAANRCAEQAGAVQVASIKTRVESTPGFSA